MLLEILSPEAKLYQGEVRSIVVPGEDGSLGILNNHAPLVASLQAGQVKVVDEQDQEKTFSIRGGVVEVHKNKVILLAD